MEQDLSLSNEQLVKNAYQIILQREVDPIGFEGWLNHLNNGMSRLDFARHLINSLEFSQKIMSEYTSDFWKSIHSVRCELVQKVIPTGEVVLDLGGANPGDPIGALLSFGYPHIPKRLYIVDLPPEKRMIPSAEVGKKLTYQGCEIEYIYTSMADLSYFEEASFDFIWSGESIEHITEEDADQAFSQVYKLLKPNGKFALDTPNRKVTRLQSPYGYIHPEHKLEYYYDEFIEKLKKHNFKIEKTAGLIDCRESIKANNFLVNEVMKNLSINESPRTSYMFYVCCVKEEVKN